MAANTLQHLLIDELQELRHAEDQLTRALDEIAQTSDALDLKSSLELHLIQTRVQITRLEQVFQMVESRVGSNGCENTLSSGQELAQLGSSERSYAGFDMIRLSA